MTEVAEYHLDSVISSLHSSCLPGKNVRVTPKEGHMLVNAPFPSLSSVMPAVDAFVFSLFRQINSTVGGALADESSGHVALYYHSCPRWW